MDQAVFSIGHLLRRKWVPVPVYLGLLVDSFRQSHLVERSWFADAPDNFIPQSLSFVVELDVTPDFEKHMLADLVAVCDNGEHRVARPFAGHRVSYPAIPAADMDDVGRLTIPCANCERCRKRVGSNYVRGDGGILCDRCADVLDV